MLCDDYFDGLTHSRQTRIFEKFSVAAVSAGAAATAMVERAQSVGPVNAERQRSRGQVENSQVMILEVNRVMLYREERS